MRQVFVITIAAMLSTISASKGSDAPRLDSNDVSWLLPVPSDQASLEDALPMVGLKAQDGTPVWSDDQFADVLSVADGEKAKVGSSRMRFSEEIRNKAVWHIAAFRFDPSAPGCSESIREQFGSSVQIRLILQPVTRSAERVKVHDVAIHLVYSFESVDEKGHKAPDDGRTRQIIQDLDSLKKLSNDAGVKTSGLPLTVHPGLAQKVPGLRSKASEFLSRHLASTRLTAMAIMGIQDPEPWFFVAMAKFPPGAKRFGAVPFLPTQMISFRSAGGIVVPVIRTNNRNPITKNLSVPEKERRGVATSVLFGTNIPAKDAMATVAVDDAGAPIADGTLRNSEIPDLIANPTASHFFNTDCVSCHTESRRRTRLELPITASAYLQGGTPPKVGESVSPKDDWNVRNFGWFPPSIFIGGGPTVATATQRTANETAEVVEFIERHFRSH